MTTRTDDRGSVTAEFAVALPAVVFVLAACLGGLAVAGQYLRVQDAAAIAARDAGRGDGTSVAARLVPGSSTSSWADGDLVCVRVAASGAVGPVSIPLAAVSCALGGGE